jgi:hypothetical protein
VDVASVKGTEEKEGDGRNVKRRKNYTYEGLPFTNRVSKVLRNSSKSGL